MTRLSTVLWFDGQAAAAMAFYAEVSGGQANPILLNGEQVAGAELQAWGGTIVALDVPSASMPLGGSIMATVADQAELDRLWDALLEGGEAKQCGWLRDRFGVLWNIVPEEMRALMSGADRAAATRVTLAMFQMIKLDIAAFRAAHKGETP